MKYIALLLLTGSLVAQSTATKASLQISQENVSDHVMCSATAIGPQAILTATHCELPMDTLSIRQFPDNDPIIVDRLRDKTDHTIYFVKGIVFPSYADVDLSPLSIGEDFVIIANPGKWADVYQKGYIAGVIVDDSLEATLGQGDPDTYLLDIQAYPGESGGGLFGTSGKLVAVLFGKESQEKGGSAIEFGAAYPFTFKQADLDKARAFSTPEPAVKHKKGKNIKWSTVTTFDRQKEKK